MTTPAKQFNELERIWKEHSQVAASLSQLTQDVSEAVDKIYSSMAAGGHLFVAGNGGSAADAQHIAAELTGRYMLERQPFRAMALHGNTSALTAIGNDYGFEAVFSRQVEALAAPGDMVVGISTSGNSPNVLKALQLARERGCHIVGLLGRDGGSIKDACSLALVVPSDDTPRIQEGHIAIIHIVCDLVEKAMFG